MQTATTYLAKIHPDLAALNALGMHRDLGGCVACRFLAMPLPYFPADTTRLYREIQRYTRRALEIDR